MLPIEELLTPIPGDNSAGVDLEYDPIYDTIEDARREDPDLPQGDWKIARKVAEWPQVVRLTSEVIAKRSKDLQLASWLVEASLRVEGVSGLRKGLELLSRLIDGFWETLYPRTDDGDASARAAMLRWVDRNLASAVRLVPFNAAGHTYSQFWESRRVPTEEAAKSDAKKKQQRADAIAENKLLPEDFETEFAGTSREWYTELVTELSAALARLDALEEVGQRRFVGGAPVYDTLRRALEEVRQGATELLTRKGGPVAAPTVVDQPGAGSASEPADTAAVESAEEPATVTVEAPPVSVAAAPTTDAWAGRPSSPSTAPDGLDGASPPRTREEAGARIAAAARFLRREDPTDPAPYLLLRGFRWGELRSRGESIPQLLLDAPSMEVRKELKSALVRGEWSGLLERAEEVMATPCGRGWLDLQRYTVTACDQLGSEYDRVAGAIRAALRSLLQDLPQLTEMGLEDDTPTANTETRNWLRESGLDEPGSEPGVPLAAPLAGSWRSTTDPFERAMDRLRAGQPQKAIELLMTEAAREKSERGRFLRRSQAASIMVDEGMETVATPILQEMVDLVRDHKLEQWEAGDIVAQPLGLLFHCLSKGDANSEEAKALYLRVCRLDPLRAVRLAPQSDDGQ
jgi:type VI secretion system protein ImpA